MADMDDIGDTLNCSMELDSMELEMAPCASMELLKCASMELQCKSKASRMVSNFSELRSAPAPKVSCLRASSVGCGSERAKLIPDQTRPDYTRPDQTT